MGYPEFSDKRRKGVYLRVVCGVRKAMLQHRRVIMLNLTTNSANTVDFSDDEKMEAIGIAWNEFHKILTDKFGEFEHYYLATNEGNGVLHVVIVGLPFVYYKRIMRWWNHIYGSFVWISKVRGSAEGIAQYLMSQYLSSQDATKVYGRMSDNWVCNRFMAYWRMLRNASRNWKDGRWIPEIDRWYYPVDVGRLIINFKVWLRYLVSTGIALEYVPGRWFVKTEQLILDIPWY